MGKLRLLGDNIAKAPVPVPDKVMFCVPRLSVRTTNVTLLPIVTGANVTFTTQLVPAGRFAPQVFVCKKSLALAPPSTTDVMGRGAVPVFCTVMASDVLEVLTSWLGNVSAVGEKVIAGATPVPLRAMLCTPRLSVNVIEAVRVPNDEGENTMLIVQFAPAASAKPQVLLWEKSLALGPANAMEVMPRDAFPEFDNVTT